MSSILERRLARARPDSQHVDHFSWKNVFRSFTSLHVILVFIIFYMSGANLFGLGLFLPSIVQQLGFSSTKTQLLSVGPFATGFIG